MDAVGSERAAILADLQDGPTALCFAGTRPERTSALILVHTSAKFVASDDYPIGVPVEVAEALLAQIDQLWGTDAIAAMWVPSRAGDERFRRWLAKMQRSTASPRAAQASLRAVLEVDVRPVLPLIQAPTLILHRKDFHAVPIEQSRYLAEHIAQARLVELPGADVVLVYETPELALDLIEEFLTGVRRTAEPTRVLATVLFTTFDGPGRGIRCAAALRDELRGIGLQIRVGLHTGEVEQRSSDVGGIAVHIAARVMALAGPGEILTSRTVRDLVVGSDIALNDCGVQPLKGIEGSWQLFTVTRP